MSDLFLNKYRIDTARLKNWDYSTAGAYFITICTAGRRCVFGRADHGKMILSQIGEIADSHWREIPRHFPNVHLDEFAVMPNHLHGIIVIAPNDTGIVESVVADTVAVDTVVAVETPDSGVSTTKTTADDVTKIQISRKTATNRNWKPGSLGVVINQYKRICTIHTRKIGYTLKWQSRFHDHIIRDENDLNRIRAYIRMNPARWRQKERTR